MKDRFVTLFGTLGVVLTLLELVLKLFNSRLCSTQGCILISQSVRYTDNIIVLGGLFVFTAILVLNLGKIRNSSLILDQLLSVSLSAEGVFIGYQLFRMKHICLFCISIFSIFVLLALIRLSKKGFSVIWGFVSFGTILFLFYILKPVTSYIPPLNKPLVLIYKQSCPHCEKVISQAKKQKINICTIKADSCESLLKSLNINEVPLLIINNKNEKKIIVGERNILQYFLDKKNIPSNNLYNSVFKDKSDFCTIGEKCK